MYQNYETWLTVDKVIAIIKQLTFVNYSVDEALVRDKGETAGIDCSERSKLVVVCRSKNIQTNKKDRHFEMKTFPI